ncbi:hypothetical protein MRX96_002454 [Rhipicephalus microplus]
MNFVRRAKRNNVAFDYGDMEQPFVRNVNSESSEYVDGERMNQDKTNAHTIFAMQPAKAHPSEPAREAQSKRASRHQNSIASGTHVECEDSCRLGYAARVGGTAV